MRKVRIVYVLGFSLLSVAAIVALVQQTAPAAAEVSQTQPGQDKGEMAQEGKAETLAVQKERVIQAIADKDVGRANTQCNQLLSRFAEDEGLAQAAYEVAVAYGDADQTEEAGQLYDHVIARWHDSEWAIHAQRDLIHAAIKRKDTQATQAALDTLLIDFGQHADIAGTVYNLAKHYRSQGNAETAARLHQYNVEHYAKDVQAMYSQIELVKAGIASGDDAATDAACNTLLTTFAQQKALPKEIYQVGVAYTKARRPERAGVFYRYVLDRWSQNPYAAWSRLALLDAEGRAESDPEVQAAVAQLMDVLPEQELSSKDLYKAALDLDQNLSKPQRALRLQRYNSEHSPQDDQYAAWSLIEVVKGHIRAGDNTAAEEATQTMLTRYADLETLPETISLFGDVYTQTSQYDQAEAMFDYIEQHWSDDKEATFWAKRGRARERVAQGDDTAVESLLQTLMADYSDDTRLPEALYSIAESYYEQADAVENRTRNEARTNGAAPKAKPALPERVGQCRHNAIAIFETVIAKWPADAENAAAAYHFAGECYNRLGDRQKAAAYYQKVCDTWPDYEYAWHLQFLVGQACEQQGQPGADTVAGSQITPEAVAAYERVVANYPDSPAARAAASRLQRYASLQEGQSL